MKLELRDYQHESLARVGAAEQRGVRSQLGVAATGLGKTVMFCALAEQRGGRTLILAHRDELINQAAAKVLEVWPGAQVGIVKAERNDVRAQVVVASVQTLARERRLAQLCQPWATDQPSLLGRAAPFDLVIVDEAHHSAADSYRAIIAALGAGEPGGPLLLGVTATPDRGDGRGLDDLFDEITFNYDILWGIRAGYLSDLRGITIEVETLDLSDVKVRRGDYDQGQAGRAMEDAEAERYVVAAWMEHALGRRTLVFTPTVETARLVADEFVRSGVSAAYVHGGTPLEERRQILRDYSAGAITVLANCAVLTEGYDEPRTDCIVIARPTKSRALYCFDSATEVLTPLGWVKGNTVAEGQPIMAFDPATGEAKWEPVLATVERPLFPEERMMAVTSPSIDIRVTDSHRMVWRHRRGRQRDRTGWKVTTAGELAQRTDTWELPVAGIEKSISVPLTDAEIAFIGWVQTDGSVNKHTNAVQISQQYPEQREHIEATLNACGFKWRVSETSASTAYGARKYPLAVYRISKGKPRGEDKHLTGWGRLEAWLPKADPGAWRRLEDMDEAQWAVLLDAWHRGDGAKQAGQSWTRRSYHLAIADEWTAGWVQAMCMRRGWRANVSLQGTVHVVHCRPGVARYVGGSAAKDRPALGETTWDPDERVWCVSVPSGAIFTRRNGKGAVVGQTQMVGRGTRRHPDKTDCLVLDIVGASNNLSLVTIPSLFGIPQDFQQKVETVGVSEVMQAWDDQQVARGAMRAEEANLFRRIRQEGMAWVAIHTDDQPLRRYVLSLGQDRDTREDRGTLVLAQRVPGEDVYTVGLQTADGDKKVLMADVALDLAQGVGEDFVRKHGGAAKVLTDAKAPWREKPMSPKARTFAKKGLHIDVDPSWNAGQLSDAINQAKARKEIRG